LYPLQGLLQHLIELEVSQFGVDDQTEIPEMLF
jgi:hypothetical protein